MERFKFLTKPGISPPLDMDFSPAVLANHKFQRAVETVSNTERLIIGVERLDGAFSRYEAKVFPEGHLDFEQNMYYVERIVKFLLWQRGGWKVYIGGPKQIGEHIRSVYSASGTRKFDFAFMGRIYDQNFTVITCTADQVPAEHEKEQSLGRNMEGNRIGFDLGASDLKVSAVVDGEAIFSTEIEWQPVEQTDPEYHRQRIQEALDLAAAKMGHVDAIGGSSAGVYVNNRPMIASLYRGIPEDKFGRIRSMFLDIREKMGVPLEVVNDGEVTALAGSMSLEDNGILGIAMGSSEAAGYVTLKGNITDWLNELAFAPVDYQPGAAIDEWSGDRGVGALYFSQQCVFRLAPEVGISIPEHLSNAQKLKFVQEKLEAGSDQAELIWETMGVYLGYTIAHYAEFYEITHVLLLGRCTSGKGGGLILENATKVLESEFPDLAKRIDLQLPSEKSRRVGQSIAAASLPKLRSE
jgi:predicted NBD/HSP70 family sugar kinase